MSIDAKIKAELEKNFSNITTHKVEFFPNCVGALGTSYTDWVPGKKLVGETPFDSRFTTPVGSYQGGILVAAIDNVFGPFSYLCFGAPMATIEMQTSFMRPFFAQDQAAIIEVKLINMSKRLLFMEAEARSKATGKILATAKTTMMATDR